MNARDLLAKTLMAEAGGEGIPGMLAAGAVIRNRAATGGYGNGIEEVIMKPGQFSAWNGVTGYAGGQGALDMANMKPSQAAYSVADTILSGQYEDPTGGATHYYNPAAANPKWGMAAGGNWQRIGNHVFGKADAGRGVSASGPVQGLLSTKDAPMTPPEQQRGLLFGLLGPKAQEFLTPERVARVQMALEGMTLNPNQGVMEAAKATLGESADRKNRNKTAEWLAKNGRPDLAEGVMSGAVPANTALTAAMKAKADAAGGPTVGAQQILPDGTIIQSTSAGPRVYAPTGEELSGDAAAAAIKSAQEYGVENQRSIYAGRREGTNVAEAETGGAAAAAGERGKQSVKISGDFFDSYNVVNKSIGSIDRAIAAIDAGAESGIVANQLPDVTQASGELKSAMNELGLAVVAGTTFGALSAPELQLALETAVPRNLQPPELRKWLVARKAAQEKAAAELARASVFFNSGGTIEQWIKENGGTRAGASDGITVETLPGLSDDAKKWINE